VELFLIALATIAAASFVIFFVMKKMAVQKDGRKKSAKSKVSRLQFFQKGAEAGFTAKEISLLLNLATKLAIDEPLSLFWSEEKLNKCIKVLIDQDRVAGKYKLPECQKFVEKLLECRKRFEVQRIMGRKGLAHTRDIDIGQPLKVIIPSIGIFKSRLVAKNSAELMIQMPDTLLAKVAAAGNGRTPPEIELAFQPVVLCFWRRDDAEYTVNSVISSVKTPPDTNESVLALRHQTDVSRVQKRKSIRANIEMAAHIYPLGDDGDSMTSAIKCVVHDISESGCAVVVNSKEEARGNVMIQFTLNGEPVSIQGSVRNIHRNEAKKLSVLHIGLQPLPTDIKNLILTGVFGIVPAGEGTDEAALIPEIPCDEKEAYNPEKQPPDFEIFTETEKEIPQSDKTDAAA
jgi:hypothetical protein